MKFTLGRPPSTNHLYKYTCRSGYARSYMTEEGRVWLEEAIYKLKPLYRKHEPTTKDLAMYVTLYLCGRADIDNYNKVLQDLLMKAGVIKDDSQIVFLQIQKKKVKHREDQYVEVELDI